MLWVPLAAAAAAVLVVGWLVSENVRLRDRLAFSNRLARAAVERAGESERVAQDARQRSDATAQPTPAASSGTAANPSLILSMVLDPGVLRSDSPAQRIRMVEGATAVRFQLSLPANVPPYSSYRVSIRTPDDVAAWSGSVPADQRDGNTVSVVVPAGALPRNDYELILSGQSSPGSMQEITSYTFSVLRH